MNQNSGQPFSAERIPGQRSKAFNWRGFTPQLIIMTFLPLTALLLVVAFGSQMLHHDAMRSLVGDRDLRAVRAAAGSLERELAHRATILQVQARSLAGAEDLQKFILPLDEVRGQYDGGLALIGIDGKVSLATQADLAALSQLSWMGGFLERVRLAKGEPVFSATYALPNSAQVWGMAGCLSGKSILVGIFSPGRVIQEAISSLASTGETTVLVVAIGESANQPVTLYRSGPVKSDANAPDHPGIREALAGESGINYYQSGEDEHVVAFSPIAPVGWGLVVEEAWEDIASPLLNTTQSAPLVIVPVLLLALVALWFGARRIIRPLQMLEKQAADLAEGDFDAIRKPVGGIAEILNLQMELMSMAEKLRVAQHSLHSYIGAITAGVENERRNLARELHDDTIQALIALNQRIQLVKMDLPPEQQDSLESLVDLVQQSLVNLRRMIRGLRPIYLEDIGLVSSLEMLARESSQSGGMPVEFELQGQEHRLDAQTEMAIYRMAQESLSNVIRHANASQAILRVVFDAGNVLVEIEDNGRGFQLPTSLAELAEKGHYGLLGLQERAELIKADLRIRSTAGKGTLVAIRVTGVISPASAPH